MEEEKSDSIDDNLKEPNSKETLNEEKNDHSKRVKYTPKDSDNNQSYKRRDEKRKLEGILREKEDKLRKLKLVKTYRAKNNLEDLEELIGKWRSICQQAAQDLYEKFNKDNTMSMGQFLNGLRVDHDLIRYSEDDESFQ